MHLLSNNLLNEFYVSAGTCFKDKQHECERIFEA